MVMILQFKEEMDDLNKFFKKVVSSGALMWKGCAALLFMCIGLAVLLVPSLTAGAEPKLRSGVGGLITAYGIFRLWTFYMEYKRLDDV